MGVQTDAVLSLSGLLMLVGWVQGKPLLSMFTIGVRYVVKAPRPLPQHRGWHAAGQAGTGVGGEILLGLAKQGLQWHMGEGLHCIEHSSLFAEGLGLYS